MMAGELSIREAREVDIPEIMRVYDAARCFMRSNGNATQWVNGYPTQKHVENDIHGHNLYVVIDTNEKIVGAFAFIIGDDPTYRQIDGAWLDSNTPYGTIHRIGSDGSQCGIMQVTLDFCYSRIGNLRIDTHSDNAKMLELMQRFGFDHCGVIICQDGTPREAFQKIIPKS